MTDETTISCDEVITRLWAFIDGELDLAAAEEIQVHLAICGHCHPCYNYQRGFREFVRRCAQEEIPPGLRRRVFERLAREDVQGC